MDGNNGNIVLPNVNKSRILMNKFLSDPRITPELKMLCFRLSTNPYLTNLIEKTPVCEVFEICEEYKKNPNLYDEIFSGNIKLLFYNSDNEPSPIVTPDKLSKASNLQMFFGNNTLAGEIVEKFIACDVTSTRINRITVKIREDKIYTAGFSPSNKLVSLIVDLLSEKHEAEIIPNFLKQTNSKRIDIIRD